MDDFFTKPKRRNRGAEPEQRGLRVFPYSLQLPCFFLLSVVAALSDHTYKMAARGSQIQILFVWFGLGLFVCLLDIQTPPSKPKERILIGPAAHS